MNLGINTISIASKVCTTIIKIIILVNDKYINTAKSNSATTMLIQSSLDI
ncbi:hypothetical protein JWF66_19150 [Clostridium botulinum]|uniref:Uncharacterized protein n=1 Tax=Clostridium botulinum (strain Okra / Type B1) TaxID=498213 RepID=B1INS0_CLOBK|nr:hypothetical protein [Clostridium botulinum]ACA47051.1 hypothetical protein CLD_A0093 [Clostridium botulinum B1 str. Okra]MBO3450087.1 hypothetical protein [Clostridium botulinum]